MKKPGASERDVSAVGALVQLLIDSGFQPNRIEAALRKTTAPANLDQLADCYAAACGHVKRPRAA